MGFFCLDIQSVYYYLLSFPVVTQGCAGTFNLFIPINLEGYLATWPDWKRLGEIKCPS